MLVKDIMTREVDYVTNENSLQEAAQKMKDLDIGELPIVVGGEAVGIITDRDITIRGVAHGLDPSSAKVIEAMTEGIVACREKDDIEKAAKMMSSHKIRRLPVMESNGNMSGVVSLGDLAQHLDSSLVGDVLKSISR